MANKEIDRLRDDLSTMRRALKLDVPYDEQDIPVVLLLGIGAMITVAAVELTSWDLRSTAAVMLAPGLLAYVRRCVLTREKRSERPGLWKEYRLSIIATAAVTPLAVGWIWWSHQFGTGAQHSGSTIVFCMGVVLLGIGILDARRRVALLVAAPMIAFALAIPMLPPDRIGTAGLGALGLALTSMAAFMWWQMRLQAPGREENDQADD